MTAVPTKRVRSICRRLGHLSILAVLVANVGADLEAQRWAKRESLTARRRAGMTYDELRGRMVLFGGIDGRGTTYAVGINETWEWDGGVWTFRSGLAVQPGQTDSAKGMEWDPFERRVLLLDFRSATTPADFWTWQGRTWQRITTPTQPTFRQHFATAFDETRRCFVMWGGSDAGGGQLDTWEYDGTDWTAVGAPGPSGRNEPALAYDGVRGKVIMFGGRAVVGGQALNDMWEWSGSAWTQLMPATLPPARNGHSMTWDPIRRRVLLFGGSTSTPGTVFNDTWEWDGTDWTRVATSVSPPARTAHAATFHSGHGRVVIACGEFAGGLLADTWEFNGREWALLTAADAPIARADHAAVFDSSRNETIMFGGRDVASVLRADTWRWKGTRWIEATPATSPPARFDHAMAFDSARGNVVLFGGFVTGGAQNDTWLWDGTNWTLANPTTRPPARYQHAMAFDSARGRVVMYGGSTTAAVLLGDTWEWDGTNWQQMTPTASPLARAEHSMAFDAARNQIVLFGGRINASSYRQDTFTYDGTTWTDRATLNVSVRGNCGMDYDPVRQNVYLYAGRSGASTYASIVLYAWNGSVWNSVTIFTFPQPGARGGATLTWDGSGQRMIGFAGESTLGKLPETWVLSYNTKAATAQLPPQPRCAGPNPASIIGFGEPVIGNAAFELDFVATNPPTLVSPVFFLLSLDQAPTGALFGPCQLTVNPATLFYTSYTLLSGTLGSLPLPIPSSLNLLGAQFIGQCLHIDPPTELNGLAFSLGTRVTIGDY